MRIFCPWLRYLSCWTAAVLSRTADLLVHLTVLSHSFAGRRVEWVPGKLQEHVARKEWYSAACTRALVLKQCIQLPTPLWYAALHLNPR